MRRIDFIDGQESLLDQPPEPPAPFEVVSYLNDNRGIIHVEDLPGFVYDPECPVRCVDFMGSIGVALAEEPPRASDWDPSLEVHGADFEKAEPGELDKGLYIKLEKGQRRPDVVVVGDGIAQISPPGAQDRYMGVAVTGDEFRTIARSPIDLANHAYAKAEEANAGREEDDRLDDETLMNTGGRAIVHAMRSKKEALLKMDAEVRDLRRATWILNNLVTRQSGLVVPVGVLNERRLDVARAIHGAVGVSSLQRRQDAMREGRADYGTTARQAIDRAVVSSMHRGDHGDPERLAGEIARYTRWAGYYLDAKRVKIYQSLSWCKAVFDANKHFLKTKKTEEIGNQAA